VGGSFSPGSKAEKELEMIASSPSNLIKVKSYDDLQSIFEGLKSKIYNIEGVHSSSNESSFELEMSQAGFSALITEDAITFGAVGAFDWSGGLVEFRGNTSTFINVSKAQSDMKNAYLGYSVKAAVRGNKTRYVVGAPRYQHRGRVIVFERGLNGSRWEPRQQIPGEQIGSYFGSELCTVDLTGDGETDLLLIGAPLYHDHGIGGIVIVCTMSPEGTFACPGTLRGDEGNDLGRFGSSIAALRDLNGDGLRDVAVGAPLEDEHRGSVYIYHGQRSGVSARYSQRIAGAQVSRGLRYFGQSLHGSMDMTRDGLTDIVVGALDKAVLLRSRPVMNVTANISMSPAEIPLWKFACSDSSPAWNRDLNNLTVCFTVAMATARNQDLRANLTYRLELDSSGLKRRVALALTERPFTRHLTVTEGVHCQQHQIQLLACVEDYLSPVELKLAFTLTPLPYAGAKDPQPTLNEECVKTLTEQLPLEKDCGDDDQCTDHLNVTFHLGG
uniref:integrin alpha-X-like n=1 Tax=Pristiophorus japonicus TaxID=55135 RepID=UPI00398EB150